MGDSLLFGDDGVYPENIYAAVLSAVQYKNYHGDYMKSLALIDTAEKVYGMGHVIIGDIYFALYRALNCKALGFPDETDASLKRAIQLAQKDGLWQIISQFSSSFDEELSRILKDTDMEGYERCRMLSDGLIDRIKKSHEEEKEKRGYRKLSSQELEVIRLVAVGRKNKEIAEELHIEVVTVKYHRQNARNKLGISAQADTSEIKEALERYEVSASWIS
ncbi:MAG: helix-turn-helix transcriptional regulator [Lachnospiraceae bacterium]|nr:helix-turn-helix transcriptional regulator [Lachnospiraceae bacterium]